MTTLDNVVEWIAGIDDEALDVVLAALQDRHDALHEARAQKAVVGTPVVVNDVTPRFLEGLEGVIEDTDPDEGEVSIRLTPAATARLRRAHQADYRTGTALTYLLTGIPASCCYPTDRLAAAV